MKWLDELRKLPDWISKGIVFIVAVAAFILAIRQHSYLYGTITGLVIWALLLFWSLLRYRERFRHHSKKHNKHDKKNPPNRYILISRYILNKDFLPVFLLLIIAALIIIIPATNNYIQIRLGLKSKPQFSAAEDGQVMIIVADFEDKSAGKASGYDLSGRIFQSLTDVIGENNLDFPVKEYHEPIVSVDEAKEVLQNYKATAIIWGSYDAAGGRLKVAYYGIEVNEDICTLHTERSDFAYSVSNPDEIEFTFAQQVPIIGSYITLVTLGKIQAQMYHDMELAEKFFTEAISIAEKDKDNGVFPADALLYRSMVYKQTEERPLELADLERILQTTPDYLQAYINLAELYSRQEEKTLAEETYNKLVSLAPDYPCGYLDRGVLYINEGLSGLAKADVTKAINLDPTSYKGYGLRGMIYSYEELYDPAIADLQEAIRLGSTNPMHYCFLGADLTQKERFDEAIAIARAGMKLIDQESEMDSQRICKIVIDGALNRSRIVLQRQKQ